MACAQALSGAQSVLKWARERPDAVAISEGGTTLTYRDLARRLAAAAIHLEAEGVRAGMVVGLQCRSRLLRVVLALACETLGAAHLSLADQQTEVEGWVASRCQLFVAEHAAERLAAFGAVVRVDEALADRLAAPVDEADLARLAVSHGADAAVRIAMTSGTSGTAKLVLKTRGMIDGAVALYDAVMPSVAGDYTYLCRYSSSINGVYTDIVRALKFGNRVRFVSVLEQIVSLCRVERCYAFMLTRDAEELASSCRAAGVNLDMLYVDVTGSGVSAALEAELKASVTACVVNVYSSNETSVIAGRERGNLYAVPQGVEVRIVDEVWRPVEPGQTGRICVRSPLVAGGYFGDEGLTARHFRDGWFLTSDLGALAAPGKLLVFGRSDDMLNIGGVKIAPYPIEQALKAVPGVADAVLLRVENAAAVGMMCVMTEIAEGAARSALFRDVADFMRSRAGGAFVVRLEDEFPRTDTGKVRRDLLQRKADAQMREMRRALAHGVRPAPAMA